MKKLTFSISLIAAAALVACGGGNTESQENAGNEAAMEEATEMAEATTNEINTEASSVEWAGTMVGVYTHTGTVDVKSGSLETAGDKVTGGSVVVDLTTMRPTDENYNPEEDATPEKLVGHLSSADFFDVETYPTATFNITGSEGNKIMGDLTVRGKTNAETVENVTYDAASNTWSGTLTFDRKNYDVAWDSPMKEMVLEDDIELKINLSL